MQMDEQEGKYPTNPASQEHPLLREECCKTYKSQPAGTFVDYETCPAQLRLTESLGKERKRRKENHTLKKFSVHCLEEIQEKNSA